MKKDKYTPRSVNAKVETEKVLGPLPKNWEKATWGPKKRTLYIDHETKKCTWIDPRTHALRKHDIRDIVPGELPYGWEEVADDLLGYYFIDHITKMNFMEGPWERDIQDMVLSRLAHINSAENKAMEERLELENKKKQELAMAAAKVNQLEAARLKLQRDLIRIQQQAEQGDMGLMDEEEERLRKELFSIQNQLEHEQHEAQQMAAEHANIQQEIAQFQKRLAELKNLNDNLENENGNLVNQTAEANANIQEMKALIEAEATQRAALEAYIRNLKYEVIEMYDPEKAEQVRAQESDPVADTAIPATFQSSPADPQTELVELRQRLEEEKEERERLKQLTETLEAEKNRIQDDIMSEQTPNHALPDWIVELNVNAHRSKSLRRKIANENPDNLKFKDKILKFTAASIDTNEKPKKPGNAPQNQNKIIKGKETAFSKK